MHVLSLWTRSTPLLRISKANGCHVGLATHNGGERVAMAETLLRTISCPVGHTPQRFVSDAPRITSLASPGAAHLFCLMAQPLLQPLFSQWLGATPSGCPW